MPDKFQRKIRIIRNTALLAAYTTTKARFTGDLTLADVNEEMYIEVLFPETRTIFEHWTRAKLVEVNLLTPGTNNSRKRNVIYAT